MDYSDVSEDEAPRDSQTNRKRSSRACDQCRKTKSKCERVGNENCKGCHLANTVCTFLGPSYKRGPPKGYIHAIESRWHQVESLLGALLLCNNPQVRGIVREMRNDELAREILDRVDAGPYGPSGRLDQPGGATKEDFFASILRSNAPNAENSRSRRQSRVSREKVSSVQNVGISVVPTKEWQDNLSHRLASAASGSRSPSFDLSGVPFTQRRRLDDMPGGTVPTPPEWKDMYTFETHDHREEEAVEGMCALSLDEHQEVRFHGQTSGLHLLGRSSRTDDRQEGGLWKLPMARIWPPVKDPAAQLISEEEMHNELPPLHIQDHLLQLYFTYIHPVFPLIHKRRFLMEYNARQTSPASSDSRLQPEPAQKCSPLLLLAIFALAARFSDQDTPPPAKGKMWEAGSSYFSAAKALLAKVLHRSRPSTCQTLLLLGYREFGIGSMEQGWIYIGMAIRMANDLGLNCNLSEWRNHSSTTKLFGPEETQTRRQIWWTCLVCDRYGSMYLGRPIAIHDDDFDTPLPEDEPDQPWETLTPNFVGSANYPGITMSAFPLILGGVITKIYPVRFLPLANRQASLAQLESRLDQWYLALPDVLRYDASSKRVTPSPPLLLLHIRYWGTVLLLHRALSESTSSHSTAELKAFDLAQGAASQISSLVTAYRETYSLKRCSPFLTSYILNAGDTSALQSASNTGLPTMPVSSQGTRGKFGATIWPSAARAFDLLNGVKLGNLNTLPPLRNQERNKRHAEDAFGPDRAPDYPVRTDSDLGQQEGVQDMANKLMAHMLGLDIPGVEPSTSFYSGCDWWSRNPETGQQQTQNWPSPTGPSMFNPLTMPGQTQAQSQRQWNEPAREGRHYNSEGYSYDHYGV
ncbi:unnamed protein product [Mycena citricolor]|uniref:Zn(2)-C6 fungal-type domain-containing protein n=1 Tax=Mycena citricolor TaxID=2018698 RepID=A0AAD2K609_9AGAR|nr:unnamed protein product [Mycena citricolor]